MGNDSHKSQITLMQSRYEKNNDEINEAIENAELGEDSDEEPVSRDYPQDNECSFFIPDKQEHKTYGERRKVLRPTFSCESYRFIPCRGIP